MGFFLGGKAKAQANQSPAVSGLRVQTSAFGKVIPLVWGRTRIAPNIGWFGDFESIAHQSQTGGGGGKGGGGGGGKGGSGGVTYTYQTALQLMLCEGPIDDVYEVWANKANGTPGSFGFSVFTGTYPQSPWSYLSTNHPSQALGYNGIAHLDASAYDLTDTPQIPNHNALVGKNQVLNTDADPSFIVTDLLTNSHYGVGFPSARIDDLTTFQDYCYATGLMLSPAIESQMTAQSFLEDLAKATNSAFRWSSGKLGIIPYGDIAVSGNGHTYTPPSSPIVDLDDNDFLPSTASTGGSSTTSNDPVKLVRKRQADQINSIKVEYLDRGNDYNPAIIEAKDQALIDTFGLRQDSSRQFHMITLSTIARQSVQLQLQRESVRNMYYFQLDERFIYLDPMDLVTITDSYLGLSRQWVRIIEITENDDRSLSIAAEEYLNGTGNSGLYDFQEGTGYSADYNSAPGDANVPIIFEPPVEIVDMGLEVWGVVSGGANWGGCEVWVSTDDATYKLLQQIRAKSRMGYTTADFPAGSDPDTTNVLSVDLTESMGTLLSGTMDDADKVHTLCYVDGELIAYETADLTAQYKYDLKTYIRRGLYGTEIKDHPSGSQFARFDQYSGIFSYFYSKDQIGQTFYVKLLSFNIYQGAKQSLSDVTPYMHTIMGPPIPPDVGEFNVRQSGAAVVFTWTPVADYALKGYDIKYGPQGAFVWDTAIFLTESAAGTEMTNGAVPPGSWTFGIKARDIVDHYSANAHTQDFDVTNESPIILDDEEDAAWTGTLSNFVEHYTGVLVPESTKNAVDMTNAEIFEQFVPYPATTCVYTSNAQDTLFDDTLRVYSFYTINPGRGIVGAETAIFAIDTWKTGETDPGTFTDWTVGSILMRYIRGRLTYTPGTTPGYLQKFEILGDRGPKTFTAGNVTVLPGGSSVTWSSPFHQIPFPTGTAQGSSALTVTFNSITTTGATVHVWDSTGADVGGVINYTVTGD